MLALAEQNDRNQPLSNPRDVKPQLSAVHTEAYEPPPSSEKRDHRHMSRMSAETKRAHAFLILWGEWNREGGGRAWPEKTLLKRIMESGPEGALIGSGHAPVSDPPPDVAAVENIVRRMGEIDRKVLAVEYVEPWCMQADKARRAHMKPAKYERTLRRARERVYFGLLAIDAFDRLS